ncbi:MAG TPA: 3-isopropylmalate dehydrogenase [Thermoanaerobaculia bacterium]|jgi:3-isopropylmalate dehydrogenase|nr:3-isopropylmalate dehydrogenase [Thermoanaerobaculia bacterium]
MSPSQSPDQRTQRIAVLPGDGIGKDVTAEAVKVLAAAAEVWDLPLELVHFDWDADRYLATGETLPAGALDDFRKNYAAVFIGAFGDPRVPDMKHAADILLGIRFGLDLYINLRPIKLIDPRLCPLKDKTEKDVDFVVFRENTEGAYVNVGGNFKKGTPDEIAMQDEIHTRKGVERIIRAAFEYAVANGRREVLMADKSNVMRYGHDLWQRCFAEVAREFSQIESRHMFVDALTMQMVLKPETLDVIVTNNMFGDIITDLGAALQGGLGMAASANVHPGQTSMFEPVHGSAPKYAGTGRANPMGAVLSSALMLETIGHKEAGRALEEAVVQAVRAGQTTVDLGGTLTTSQVGDLLARTVASTAAGATR